jgi:GNAT superfamily N-acetyltransferase
MPLVLERSWVGHRVVVRRAVSRSDDGRLLFGDVVGDLIELGAERAIVDTSSGPVEVRLDHIATAKAVIPSSRDILALEATCARGWRARETAELDGWLLRANDGFTGRANSVLPLRQLRLPLADALAQAGDWYHARGLPLKLQTSLPARQLLDAAVREEGYDTSPEVHVLMARLDCLPPIDVKADELASAVQLADAPDERWLGRYRDGTVPAAARELLIRHDRVTFAAIERDARVIAIARGAVDDGWLGVTAVEVDPEFRRQGLASAVMAELWRWGAERHQARYSYLQVESTNFAALALYERLGYWHHHDYRYLTEPS